MTQCSICFDDVDSTTKFNTECEHSFCNKCITGWLLFKSTCPYCRNKLVDVDTEDEEQAEEEDALRISVFNSFGSNIFEYVYLVDKINTIIDNAVISWSENDKLPDKWYKDKDTGLWLYRVSKTRKRGRNRDGCILEFDPNRRRYLYSRTNNNINRVHFYIYKIRDLSDHARLNNYKTAKYNKTLMKNINHKSFRRNMLKR